MNWRLSFSFTLMRIYLYLPGIVWYLCFHFLIMIHFALQGYCLMFYITSFMFAFIELYLNFNNFSSFLHFWSLKFQDLFFQYSTLCCLYWKYLDHGSMMKFTVLGIGQNYYLVDCYSLEIWNSYFRNCLWCFVQFHWNCYFYKCFHILGLCTFDLRHCCWSPASTASGAFTNFCLTPIIQLTFTIWIIFVFSFSSFSSITHWLDLPSISLWSLIPPARQARAQSFLSWCLSYLFSRWYAVLLGWFSGRSDSLSSQIEVLPTFELNSAGILAAQVFTIHLVLESCQRVWFNSWPARLFHWLISMCAHDTRSYYPSWLC